MTAPWLSPSWPIQERLDLVFKGDDDLAAMLAGRKVYSKLAQKTGETRPLPYIVMVSQPEIGQNAFGKKGHLTTTEFHIVADDKYQLALIYNHCKRLLDGVRLTLTDHTSVQGTLEKIIDFPEENLMGERQVCQYTVRSYAEA